MADESNYLETLGIGSDYDPTGLEERMASGGLVPPGLYSATLHGAKKEISKVKETKGHELTFKISSGPYAGETVTDTLWISKSEKPSTRKKSEDRIALFSSRLGLTTRDPHSGKLVLVKGKQEFMDCLDTPCVIEVVVEEYDRKDESGNVTGRGKSNRLAFGGLYDPTDPKVQEKLTKQAAGEPVTAGAKEAAGTKPATKTDGTPKEPIKTTGPKATDLSEL